jgi:hypothetical protein
MKAFKIASRIVGAWIAAALLFDGVMIYCHFANPELEDVIISHIDKIIY